MIKIQDHLNIPNPDDVLDSMAEEHWNNLNPKYKTKTGYKSSSLIEKINTYYNSTNEINYIEEYADNIKSKAKRHRSLFFFLKKNNYDQLKKLIISKPHQFNAIIGGIFKHIKNEDLWVEKSGKICQTKFGKLLSEDILNYKKHRSSSNCISQYERLDFINVTCPYCNDHLVEIVKKNTNTGRETHNIAYFDLDHFYPKSLYPFLALSFYNLIPSCNICNSREKGEKDFNIDRHVHPYIDSFDDLFQFRISLVNVLGGQVDKIYIEQKLPNGKQKSISDLNLLNRYNNKILLVEQLTKFYQNNYKRYNTPEDVLTFKEMFFELRGVPRIQNSILKHPQGKLLRDILKQIDTKDLLDIG